MREAERGGDERSDVGLSRYPAFDPYRKSTPLNLKYPMDFTFPTSRKIPIA